FGSLLAVASRHGVVEPAMGRVAIKPHMIALLRPFHATAEPDHIIHGYDMIRLSEDSQYGARYLRHEFLDRGRSKLVAIPFLAADGAIKHHNSGDIISISGEQQWLSAGLTNADDTNPRTIDISRFF